MGVPSRLASAWRDGQLVWVPWTAGTGARIWFLTLVVSAIALSLMAKAHYQARFGDVQSAATIKAPLAAFVFTALFVVAASRQTGLQASVSIPAVLVVIGVGDHLVLRRTLVPVAHVNAI